jgi:hypothetical protein
LSLHPDIERESGTDEDDDYDDDEYDDQSEYDVTHILDDENEEVSSAESNVDLTEENIPKNGVSGEKPHIQTNNFSDEDVDYKV